jgi:hypothetical protein
VDEEDGENVEKCPETDSALAGGEETPARIHGHY